MKHVLITGSESYIGTAVERWLNRYPKQYVIRTVDMRGGAWKDMDWSSYDVVFHVAGKAHADIGHVSEDIKQIYYKINRDLAIEAAEKAKREGVRQFIFMSSIIVYGSSGDKEKRVITVETMPTPDNFYGDSKLQAEVGLLKLRDDTFDVAVIRAPMIYGKGSKGNYRMLAKLALKLPLFPNIKNERSMLHIDNLCEFVRLLIEHKGDGLFYPQNKDYVSTSEMVRMIAQVHGKKIWITSCFNWVIHLLRYISPKARALTDKAFGNLVYDKNLSGYEELFKTDYRVRDFNNSIKYTEL